MRIFVTGATGVLGRRAVPRLIAAGHDVTAVARSQEKADRLRALGASPAVVDLFDASAVRVAVAGHDAVVNLATSIPPMSRAALRRSWADNDRLRTEASRHLVEAALATGAQLFVQESISFLYAEGGDRWLDENAPVEPAGVTASAEVAEAEAARFTSGGGHGLVLRFGQFVASDSGHLLDQLPILRRGLLPLFGDHAGYESFIAVEDAADAVVAALDAPAGTYNVTDGEPLTRAAHAAILTEVLGRRVRLPPALVGSIPALEVRARSQRVSNGRLREATTWRPACASMREQWPTLIAALGREVDRVA